MPEASTESTVVVEGELLRTTVPTWYRRIRKAVLSMPEGATLGLDLSGVTRMDSSGAAMCLAVRDLARRMGRSVRLLAASEHARQTLSAFTLTARPPEPARAEEGALERLGDSAVGIGSAVLDLLVLAADALYHTWRSIFVRRKTMDLQAVVEQTYRIGVGSLGIVAVLSLLVGLTVGLQSAYQLRQFGANIYIANLVGIAMTREMGPLMTAILLAGRSGSAMAAEISTMVVTEEVDALRTMGMNPVRFLVVPRFLGMSLTQPLLTVVSDLMGILGGFLVAILYLQLGMHAFLDQLVSALLVKDVLVGLLKSVSFAWIIVFVAVHTGLRAKGGAEGVGRGTTSAVVRSIFLVIAADALFSLVFYFGG